MKFQDFTLKNQDLEDVSLDSLVSDGPAVILFFPLAFTSVCTEELCSVTTNWKGFSDLNNNVSVVGISVDSPFTLKEFKKQNNIGFDLLSDFNKEVSQSAGAFYEDFLGMHGVSKRAAFIVQPDKTISYQWVSDDAGVQPNFTEIADQLKATV